MLVVLPGNVGGVGIDVAAGALEVVELLADERREILLLAVEDLARLVERELREKVIAALLQELHYPIGSSRRSLSVHARPTPQNALRAATDVTETGWAHQLLGAAPRSEREVLADPRGAGAVALRIIAERAERGQRAQRRLAVGKAIEIRGRGGCPRAVSLRKLRDRLSRVARGAVHWDLAVGASEDRQRLDALHEVGWSDVLE